MSLKKQYNQTKPMCRVTFKLAKNYVGSANQVILTGDFNSWDCESIPMKKLKNGEYTASLDLKKGREYQFKYLIDGCEWLNDTAADKFVRNEFRSENSVVIV